jgi:mono/diheme cytochrome c family protein
VTEIPEHLLKRSRERRQAIGGEAPAEQTPAAAGAEPVPASAAPATPAPSAAPSAAPRPAAPERVKPDAPYVAAAKQRKKIPIWAMAVLSLLPLWGFMYVRSLTATEETVEGPLAAGATGYASACASCHAAGGEGGAGRPLYQGEVLKTFPTIEDQLNFVYTGSQPYDGVGFGDPEREGGQRIGLEYNGSPMPAFGGQLSDAEILAVVCHERYTLSGADPTGDYAEEYATWCGPESEHYPALLAGSESFASLEGVGTDPRS